LSEVDTKLLFRLPPSKVPGVDVEELLAKAPPVEHEGNLTAKIAMAEATRRALANYSDDHPLHDAAVKTLDTQMAEIERLKKKAPCESVYVAQLRTAADSYAEHAAMQRQRAVEGTRKASERKDIQVGIIDEMSRQLQKLKVDLLASFDGAAQAWASYQAAREEQWTAIQDEFEARIASLKARPPPTGPTTALALAPDYILSPGAAAPRTADVVDPVQQVRLDAQDAYAKLAAAQLAMQEAVKAQAAAEQEVQRAKAAAVTPEHEATFDGEISELPTMVPEPQGEQWTQLHNLWTALDLLRRQEAFAGGLVPVTYSQLQSGLEVPELLLGSVLWAKAYPGSPPTLDTIVTVQVRALLSISMEAHTVKLQADRVRQLAAKDATEAGITAAVSEFRSKRRRCAESSPPPVLAAIGDGSASSA